LVDVESRSEFSQPGSFALAQNYPNPFNPSTTIRFQVPTASQVTLTIYSTLGQKVQALLDRRFDAGHHQVTWDGRDDAGKHVTSGVYFVRMVAANGNSSKAFVQVRKMLLVH
jgi:flagellar hook assembly protein FlgD